MDADVGLEAETVDDGDQALDGVKRGAGDGAVGQDVAAAAREDGVEAGDGVRGAGHADAVDGLHQARRGHEEGGVDCSAGGRDDLAAAAEDGFGGEGDGGYFEAGVADRWVVGWCGQLMAGGLMLVEGVFGGDEL